LWIRRPAEKNAPTGPNGPADVILCFRPSYAGEREIVRRNGHTLGSIDRDEEDAESDIIESLGACVESLAAEGERT